MTFEEITKAASGHKWGERGTPLVSFWPMKKKWQAFGDYWELWGFDGDLSVNKETRILWSPTILKLIYFKVPGTETVCQLSYVIEPAQPETSKLGLMRARMVQENMKFAIDKKHPVIEGDRKELAS